MTPLWTAVGFVVNTALLYAMTRRLIGIPVGWFRTLVVAIILTSGMSRFLILTSEGLGLPTQADALSGRDGIVVGLVFVLITAWGVALGVGALVLLEAVLPTGAVPSLLDVVRDLPARRRRSVRYGQFTAIAVRHGLGGFLRAGSRPPDESERALLGRRLRLAFTDAGVTFVKLGQMLATRVDLVGTDLARELGRLQSDNRAEDWTQIEATLRDELGEDWRAQFASFDEVPLAAASVGQVHRAVLTDGTPVVAKVQRASAAQQVRADLDILVRMARWLDRTTDWGPTLGVRSLVAGFAASLEEELDYRVEAANAAGVAASTGQGSESPVRVPATYPALSSARVLVMEEVHGTPLSRPGAADHLDAATRTRLADALLGSVMAQVLQTGVFHADLHAGNVLLEDRPEGSRIALLDFGAVGRLDRTAREAIGRLLYAVDRGDAVGAVDALCDVLDPPPELDDRALEREVGAVITRVQGGVAGTSTIFGDLFTMVVRHGFTVPPQIAAAFRALGALEGTLTVLNPDIDIIVAARAAGADHIGTRLRPGQLRATLEEQLVHMVPILQRLPRRLDGIAATIQGGDAQLRLRWLSHPEDRAFITGVVHHLVITTLAAVLAICGVVLMVADGGPALTPTLGLLPVLGSTLFLFAFVLGARALALVFRSSR
ncbi:ABC1 kinase family protein [Kribbia dieselivorans]|uniref:ABC1 kinase family protein n=1 Tax=Kribbia dieselivorans TaxID=331526 RepID=UPI0008396486|nr:AarF/ABC1/UbiB kinase family protein [Kribbia dieselivorans]